MKNVNETFIPVLGRDDVINRKLVDWERKLDIHFKNKVNKFSLSESTYLFNEDFSDLINWREFVGIRITMIDWGDLRYRIDINNRVNLLPAICLSLAIWGECLQGTEEQLRDFLFPFDNLFILNELSGYGEINNADDRFYACLNSLTKEQRYCIAEFIEFYFGMYKSSFSWYTERSKAAAEELARIWRGEKVQ